MLVNKRGRVAIETLVRIVLLAVIIIGLVSIWYLKFRGMFKWG